MLRSYKTTGLIGWAQIELDGPCRPYPRDRAPPIRASVAYDNCEFGLSLVADGDRTLELNRGQGRTRGGEAQRSAMRRNDSE